MAIRQNNLSKGDESRFISLIESNKESLYKIAYSYVKNKDDALDIVQEATYKGYISYHRVKSKEYEKTWLTRILINTAIDFLKKKQRVINFDTNIVNEATEDSSNTVNNRIDIEESLDKLNYKQRTIIVLRFFEDMKLEDIAAIMDMPLSTVKSNLYRGLEAMKIELKE